MSFRSPLVALAGSLFIFSVVACVSTDPPAGSGGTGGGGTGGSSGGRGGSGSGGSSGSSGGSTATGGASGGNSGTGGSSGGAGGSTGGSSGGAGGSTGGAGGAGGSTGGASGGSGGSGGSTGGAGGSSSDTRPAEMGGGTSERFSFFVTSLAAMRRLSKSQNGFGGDLRYGQADGLSGADKICTELAEGSMPGAGAKGWRAFLSANMGPGGAPVHAIDRIGEGPWYDRRGRLFAMTKADLLFTRPRGADPAIANDFPNEDGIPNHRPDPTMPAVDNHHFLTGSNAQGRLYMGTNPTCSNWTSSARTVGIRPRIGFSWPAGGRENWISGQDEGGCGAGVNIFGSGGSDPSNPIVGSGGGYGGIYCFALKP